MALSNLADVTRTLVTLIDWALRRSGDWPVGGVPSVLPLPPDRMSENGLSVFLYHVQENVYNKNMHLPDAGSSPVRSAPMALNLYFQVSARMVSDPVSADDAFSEQLMMSTALQAMHDYADLADSTVLDEPNPTPDIRLLDRHGLAGRTNRFKISLQPVPANDSVHYWTAGQSPMRLAAYYEVSIVFLEPKEPPKPVGRVLTYGTFLFTEGAPQLTGSRNTVAFTIPGEADPRQIDIQPAQAAAGQSLDLLGVNFGGDRVDVQLLNTQLPGGMVLLDALWNLTRTSDNLLTLTVQEAAGGVAVLPGIYAAQVIVTRRRTPPNGNPRDFRYVSNSFPVTISPRIDAVTAPDAANRISISGFRFQNAALPTGSVQLYVGDTRLTERITAGNPVAGEFKVTAPNTIVASLAGLVAGQVLPLRVLVAGAEAAPRWITTP
jgi:hypothetical protein